MGKKNRALVEKLEAALEMRRYGVFRFAQDDTTSKSAEQRTTQTRAAHYVRRRTTTSTLER